MRQSSSARLTVDDALSFHLFHSISFFVYLSFCLVWNKPPALYPCWLIIFNGRERKERENQKWATGRKKELLSPLNGHIYIHIWEQIICNRNRSLFWEDISWRLSTWLMASRTGFLFLFHSCCCWCWCSPSEASFERMDFHLVCRHCFWWNHYVWNEYFARSISQIVCFRSFPTETRRRMGAPEVDH